MRITEDRPPVTGTKLCERVHLLNGNEAGCIIIECLHYTLRLVEIDIIECPFVWTFFSIAKMFMGYLMEVIP
jgi:hypothetical protein